MKTQKCQQIPGGKLLKLFFPQSNKYVWTLKKTDFNKRRKKIPAVYLFLSPGTAYKTLTTYNAPAQAQMTSATYVSYVVGSTKIPCRSLNQELVVLLQSGSV